MGLSGYSESEIIVGSGGVSKLTDEELVDLARLTRDLSNLQTDWAKHIAVPILRELADRFAAIHNF